MMNLSQFSSLMLSHSVELLVIEMFTFLTSFLLCLHLSAKTSHRSLWKCIGLILQFGSHHVLCSIYSHYSSAEIWYRPSFIVIPYSNLPPLYILFFSMNCYYISDQMIEYFFCFQELPSNFSQTVKLKIQKGMLMGLLNTLLRLPMEIVGTKMLFWTWHDTDPMYVPRIAGVPIVILIYTLSFSTTLSCLDQFLAIETSHEDVLTRGSVALLSSALSFPCTQIYTRVIFSIMMPFCSTFVMWQSLVLVHVIVLILRSVPSGIHSSTGSRLKHTLTRALATLDDREYQEHWTDKTLWDVLLIQYLPLMVLVVLIAPEQVVSIGHHQMLGDCSILQHGRPKYLCPYDIQGDFHFCNSDELPFGEHQYRICGQGYPSTQAYHDMVLIVLGLLATILATTARILIGFQDQLDFYSRLSRQEQCPE